MKNKNEIQDYTTPYIPYPCERKTIKIAIAEKFVKWVENNTILQMLRKVSLVLLVFLTVLALTYPTTIVSLISSLIAFKAYFFPKLLIISLIFWNWSKIKKAKADIAKRFSPRSDLIEGVPVNEILDHLFEHGNFRRDDIENKFSMPRHKFQALATKLDSLGVLVRGDKNLRVLNKEYSRQDIAKILSNKGKASRISGLWRTKENGMTCEPSALEIASRVEENINPFRIQQIR